tara:strand:+ start:207 stop:596 length:390 start_codon:yes stop_codon:yes gene_type:complete
MDINELMEMSKDLVVPVPVPAVVAITELLGALHQGLDEGHMVLSDGDDDELADHIKREIEAAIELMKLFVTREAAKQIAFAKEAVFHETGEEVNDFDELKEMLVGLDLLPEFREGLKNVLVFPTEDIEA